MVEGYYDHSDFDDPVKYRINYDNYEVLNTYRSDQYLFKIQRHFLNKLDGSTQTFFTAELLYFRYDEITVLSFYASIFILHHEYIQYDQYIDYRLSPSTRRLNSESSTKNDSIMPGHYFVFYIMAQCGGLYVFLHLVFGLFMNRWTEQHFKQTLMNELYSNIEAKSKSRNQVLSRQAERNTSAKVSPDNVSPNLGMNVSHNNEQYPLINEQPIKTRNNVHENNSNRQSYQKVRDQESRINEPESLLVSDMNRNQNARRSKSFYNCKDAMYGFLCCIK